MVFAVRAKHLLIWFLLYVIVSATLIFHLSRNVSHNRSPCELLYRWSEFFLSPSMLAIRVTSNKFPSGNVINTTGDVVGDSREEK